VIAAITNAAPNRLDNPVVTRLQEQLEERDEIIVALQHVIRDLRHEIDNLRAEDAYAAFLSGGRDRQTGRARTRQCRLVPRHSPVHQ
jgi:hypothetical protein